MNAAEYRRRWSTGHAKAEAGLRVQVPEDVQRVSESEPCFQCGTARGMCRHRRAA
jgi:heterodisulfide reductase subunit C